MSPFVHPEMAEILKEFQAQPAVDLKTLPIAEARRMSDTASAAWSIGAPAMAVVEVTIPGAIADARPGLSPDGGDDLPVILFVHGGGWTFGSLDHP